VLFRSESLFDDASDTNKQLIAVSKPKISTAVGSFHKGVQHTILTTGTTDFTLIGLANNNITSGSFVIGTKYKIVTVGTTDYTLVGAADSNVDTIFTATGVGIGTGTVTTIGAVGDIFTSEGTFFKWNGTDWISATLSVLTDEPGAGNVDALGLPLNTFGSSGDFVVLTYDVTDTYWEKVTSAWIQMPTASTGDFQFSSVAPTLQSDGTVLVSGDVYVLLSGTGTATYISGTNVEFMLYDKKVVLTGTSNAELTISNRTLYTGLGYEFVNLDSVHVLDTPLQLVLQDL
jgi:hypothetical protein